MRLFYLDTAIHDFISIHSIDTYNSVQIWNNVRFYIDTKNDTRYCASIVCVAVTPKCSSRVISLRYSVKFAPRKNSRLFENGSPLFSWRETIPCISLANIAGAMARTACMHTLWRNGDEIPQRFCAQMRRFITNVDARARSIEPKRPSASIFCPRQRFFFVFPLSNPLGGRPLRGRDVPVH